MKHSCSGKGGVKRKNPVNCPGKVVSHWGGGARVLGSQPAEKGEKRNNEQL